MSNRIAVFPGSFDPITLGHFDIVSRALPLFDKIIIAIGQNAAKNYMFTLEERMGFIKTIFANTPKIEVHTYSGLTVNFCKEVGAQFLLRGLRNPADFEFEKAIAQANRQMEKDIETVFLLTTARYSYISSSIVRDIIRHGGDYSGLVPEGMKFNPTSK
ncbi:MAG: pantetheine-phosphate adenylyltransferase [Cryomorphaceae bacterium]|nr:pantetheine-phosphate adenylyltransferase [Cryomorphaceae bacterium]